MIKSKAAMPSQALTKSYAGLLAQIKSTIASARKQIELTKALAYWKIGEAISRHVLNQNGRAQYGQRLYKRLAKDLNLSKRILHQSVQFYREFPKVNARSQLDWTHYRKLITVDDPLVRNRLLKKAQKNNLTTRQLAREIRSTTYDGRNTKSAPKLIPKQGQLYVYKLIDVEGTLEVDCGFHVTRALALTGLKAPKEGMRVISQKTNTGFTFAAFSGTHRDLYTYKAGSLRVIDGDTLSCRIDCGFKTKIKRTLRLRGINAPELKSTAGQAAKRFVQRRLRGKSAIIFRSWGLDNHGRYVADVFYESKGGGETYLNQELLNRGHARRYAG